MCSTIRRDGTATTAGKCGQACKRPVPLDGGLAICSTIRWDGTVTTAVTKDCPIPPDGELRMSMSVRQDGMVLTAAVPMIEQGPSRPTGR